MGIIENAKDIAQLIKKYNDADLYQKIVDLRDEIFELREENLGLKEKIKNLEKDQYIQSQLTWEPPYYFLKKEEKKDGPYCQKCWDENKKLIRLQDHKNGCWSCLACKNVVVDSSFQQSEQQDCHDPYEGWMSR